MFEGEEMNTEAALKFYEEMQLCPWFTSHRTEECICQEYRNLDKTLVVVNNECKQHGCSQNNQNRIPKK